MNITKTISGLVAVAGLTLVTAGASMAQIEFGYTTTFSPNPIQTSPPAFGNVIQVFPQLNPDVTAKNVALGPLASAINLDNFKETSTTSFPTELPVNQVFTVGLTVTPYVGGVPQPGLAQTQSFTGTLTGMFSKTTSETNVDVTMITPQPYTYNFGSLGDLTIGLFNYDEPGPQQSTGQGSLSVRVTSLPPVTKTPEPATVIPFALGGLGLLGLIVRKTRRAGGAAA